MHICWETRQCQTTRCGVPQLLASACICSSWKTQLCSAKAVNQLRFEQKRSLPGQINPQAAKLTKSCDDAEGTARQVPTNLSRSQACMCINSSSGRSIKARFAGSLWRFLPGFCSIAQRLGSGALPGWASPRGVISRGVLCPAMPVS